MSDPVRRAEERTMSTKYFCDQCGIRVTDENSPNGELNRIVRKKGNITVQILVARNGTWNAGEFCTKCIEDAALTGDDIPWFPANEEAPHV